LNRFYDAKNEDKEGYLRLSFAFCVDRDPEFKMIHVNYISNGYVDSVNTCINAKQAAMLQASATRIPSSLIENQILQESFAWIFIYLHCVQRLRLLC